MTENSAEKKIKPTVPVWQRNFARVSLQHAAISADKERIKVLTDTNITNVCGRSNLLSTQNITKKKAAKDESGKHFGWSGKMVLPSY